MAYSEASKRATNKYIKNHMKRISLNLQNEKYIEIKKIADALGEPVSTFIKKAVDERVESIKALHTQS